MKTNVQYQTSIETLISGMSTNGRYDYLKIILSKNEDITLPKKYLMVTKQNFGIVRLLNVYFKEDYIKMKVECTTTGMVKQIVFDVEDETFKFLMIDWTEIKGMVYEESSSNTDGELLDFVF